MDLLNESRKPLRKIGADGWLNKGIVYMDDGAAQAIRWMGGINFLTSLGVISCHDILDPPQYKLHKNVSKDDINLIFILSDVTSVTIQRERLYTIIRDINTEYESNIYKLSIYVSFDNDSIRSYLAGSDSLINEIEILTLQRIEREIKEIVNLCNNIHVNYLPLYYCTLLRGGSDSIGAFILASPLVSEIFPYSLNDLKESTKIRIKDGRDDINPSDLCNDIRRGYSMLSYTLAYLLRQLGLNIDGSTFALGKTSNLIGNKVIETLRELSSISPISNTKDATLILIDRTLDLVSSCKHGDNILDQIYNSLPSTSYSIDRDICNNHNSLSESYIFGGSLCQCDNPSAQGIINSISTKKDIAVLGELKAALLEIELNEIEEEEEEGEISRDDSCLELLDEIRQSFNRIVTYKDGSIAYKYIELLQVVATVIVSRDQSTSGELSTLEYISRNTCHETGELLLPIIDLLSVRHRDSDGTQMISLKDIFKFIIYNYSLAGVSPGIDIENIDTLQDAITVALLASDKDTLQTLNLFECDFLDEMEKIKKEGNENEISKIRNQIYNTVKDMIQDLDQIAASRSLFHTFDKLIQDSNYISLISQLLTCIYDPERKDIPDLIPIGNIMQQFVGGLFGRFISSVKPRPGDRQTLILFFIGGITGSELGEIRDFKAMLKSRDGDKIDIIVGSNNIASSDYIYDRVFM